MKELKATDFRRFGRNTSPTFTILKVRRCCFSSVTSGSSPLRRFTHCGILALSELSGREFDACKDE